MEATASMFQHAYGPGLRGPSQPHGTQHAQGPHQPPQGPYGAPRPEEQHQHQHPQQYHKPFFYVQPSQPYMPMQNLQWPMPMPMPMPISYNPYCGYPGLGYSMPVMPHYQQSPYMQPPSYILPQNHLHLVDYRSMLNPHHYQTMAYHSRRFRYQQNAPAREMISSEVQTEPLLSTQMFNPMASSGVEASTGLPVCSINDPDKTTSVPASEILPPAFAVQKGDRSADHEDMVPSSTTVAPPKSSFVIQTEEVRIECCLPPVGLNVLHETAELAHGYSQDMGQCSTILEGHVLQEGLCLPAEQSEQCLHACPDILLVGTAPCSSPEKILALEESSNQVEHVSVASDMDSIVVHSDAQVTRFEKDTNIDGKSVNFKVLHLPFDLEYLEELRKMESTVWSMEETCIPSSEWLFQNGLMESHTETTPVAEVFLADELMLREEVPMEEVFPMAEMPPLLKDIVAEVMPAVLGPVTEMASEADVCPTMDVLVTEVAHMSELLSTAEVTLTSSSLLLNSTLSADISQQIGEMNDQDHQETSFESLPASIPSTSWIADNQTAHYCSKMPQTPQKQTKPLSRRAPEMPIRRRRLDLECKERPTVKPKDRYKNKTKVDRRSLSDHECCRNRNFDENAFNENACSKGGRLCARCLANHSINMSVSPGLVAQILKRKAVPFQPWNDTLLPTCEACKSHSKKRATRQGSSSDVPGQYRGDDTGGETSENSSCWMGPKWRGPEDRRKLADPKRHIVSKQHAEKCPAALYSKLREKNCACNTPQHQPVAGEGLHQRPHSKTIREMNEQNCTMPFSLQDKLRHMEQRYLAYKRQTESWKARESTPDTDGSKNGVRSHLNKQKKSQPQSQGTHRKDTRC